LHNAERAKFHLMLQRTLARRHQRNLQVKFSLKHIQNFQLESWQSRDGIQMW